MWPVCVGAEAAPWMNTPNNHNHQTTYHNHNTKPYRPAHKMNPPGVLPERQR